MTRASEIIEPWLKNVLKHGPKCIGLSGAQGIGKTTLCAELLQRAREWGYRAVSVSIDDFYLSNAEQRGLAERHPENKYLQSRGYPGTHDLALGTRVLKDLKRLSANQSMRVPLYDKSVAGGAGDRAPESKWKNIDGPLDLILFEGWMLGFEPVAVSTIQDPELQVINSQIQIYSKWWELVDEWIFLDPIEIAYVKNWRIEAEDKMRERGMGAMSVDAAQAYIEKFIVAYETYLPGLREKFSHARGHGSNPLVLRIQKDRTVAP